ncbi:MAG TPA: dihydrolipoamide acetyltransferase family protein [Caulobacteraceae bacterium]
MGRYVFKLPDVGEGTAEAEIVVWHAAVGEHIEEDQPLVDVLTDKATVEMTAPVSGLVVSVHGEPGEMAAVGSTLAVIETGGADAGEAKAVDPAPRVAPRPLADPTPKPPIRVTTSPTEPAAPPPPSPEVARARSEEPLASPAVRRRAHELGVALQFVTGGGPAGRIRLEDLERFIASPAERPRMNGGARSPRRDGVDQVKIIGLRRKIAEKMQEAKRRIPHFAYVEEIDVTELEELRAHLNVSAQAGRARLTFLPFLIRALVEVLPRYPQINARFDDDAGIVHRHQAVHAGIATQTANGLIVPVLRHAEERDLWDCAAEIARLAAAARDGKATADELRGSTITITSLGPLGGVVTTPVINHPEVAIIGPNKITERPVVRHGQIVIRKVMNLSSSFDHRVVDGYDAADFIQKVKALLEHPATLFMGFE